MYKISSNCPTQASQVKTKLQSFRTIVLLDKTSTAIQSSVVLDYITLNEKVLCTSTTSSAKFPNNSFVGHFNCYTMQWSRVTLNFQRGLCTEIHFRNPFKEGAADSSGQGASYHPRWFKLLLLTL